LQLNAKLKIFSSCFSKRRKLRHLRAEFTWLERELLPSVELAREAEFLSKLRSESTIQHHQALIDALSIDVELRTTGTLERALLAIDSVRTQRAVNTALEFVGAAQVRSKLTGNLEQRLLKKMKTRSRASAAAIKKAGLAPKRKSQPGGSIRVRSALAKTNRTVLVASCLGLDTVQIIEQKQVLLDLSVMYGLKSKLHSIAKSHNLSKSDRKSARNATAAVLNDTRKVLSKTV
jgi:hypothetical protein